MAAPTELFQVRTPDDALRRLLESLPPSGPPERIPTAQALDRVLAEDLVSPSDLPTFHRSTMDGFAVRAPDTFGATEGLPAYLEIQGEVLMGQAPEIVLQPGHCARISTGGMLPTGADAVVMVEQTQEVGRATLEVLRAVAPGENVVGIGEDVRQGEPVLPRGQTLRPQDLGGLLALGINSVQVARRLRVGILSTGNEVVSPDVAPGPGQVRDVNGYTLAALVTRLGHAPCSAGIVGDEEEALRTAARDALARSDVLIISAGSSVSTRDLSAQIIHELGRPGVLVHGVALRPGKPTVLAVCDGKAVFGLPGNPVSCMVTFDLFVAPTLTYLCGASAPLRGTVPARLARNVASASGRVDYVQVRLVQTERGLEARPVFGKSNLIFTLMRADGMVRVPLDKGGLAAGEWVDVVLF